MPCVPLASAPRRRLGFTSKHDNTSTDRSETKELTFSMEQELSMLSNQNTAFFRIFFAAAIWSPAADDLPETTGARRR